MATPRSDRLGRLLPGFAQLRGYRRSWLRGDLVAGLTVAAYLVPQVMAYGTLAVLPPVAGLWAILAPLAVYALVGSSRQMSVGPEPTTALMTATVVAPLDLPEGAGADALVMQTARMDRSGRGVCPLPLACAGLRAGVIASRSLSWVALCWSGRGPRGCTWWASVAS